MSRHKNNSNQGEGQAYIEIKVIAIIDLLSGFGIMVKFRNLVFWSEHSDQRRYLFDIFIYILASSKLISVEFPHNNMPTIIHVT